MTAHVHAENMKLYAQDAAETDKPFERWECRNPSTTREWHGCGSWFDMFDPKWHYRRKPRTHTVNGFEVPEPMRVGLALGSMYWLADPTHKEFTTELGWDGIRSEDRWLARGLVHATKEAAIANAKAMLGIAP